MVTVTNETICKALLVTKKANGTMSDFVTNVLAIDSTANSDGKLRSRLNSRLTQWRNKYKDKKDLFTLKHEHKGRKAADISGLIEGLQNLQENVDENDE